MGRAELFRVEMGSDTYAPGEVVTGTVVVVAPGDVRGVHLELVRVQSSARGGPPEVYAAQSVTLRGPGSVEPGDRHPFALTIAADASPGFATPHGSLAWGVRVRSDVFGPDLVEHTPITITPPTPDTPLPSPARLASLAAATAERNQADRTTNALLGYAFVGIGALFVVLGLFWAASPPESWEDGSTTGLLAFVFVFAVFLIGCGALVLLAQRTRPLVGVEVRLDTPGVRPGHALTLTATNGSGAPLAIGYECVEIVREVRQSGQGAVVSHATRVLHAEWSDLPAGEHRRSFAVPPDVPASFPGEHVAVDHRVVVVPAGKERSKRNRTRLRTHVAVVR